MDEKESILWIEDTEEMVSWRSSSQEEIDKCWLKMAGKSEDEVLDKYRVEYRKREAYKA